MGVRALVVGPLKNNIFCGFPKRINLEIKTDWLFFCYTDLKGFLYLTLIMWSKKNIFDIYYKSDQIRPKRKEEKNMVGLADEAGNYKFGSWYLFSLFSHFFVIYIYIYTIINKNVTYLQTLRSIWSILCYVIYLKLNKDMKHCYHNIIYKQHFIVVVILLYDIGQELESFIKRLNL